MNRPRAGRALFYTRDSGGEHESTPAQYVEWARRKATDLCVAFRGTAQRIHAMIAGGVSVDGDLFVDFGVKGNQLTRPALDALVREAMSDATVSHILIPRRDRLARPDEPTDALQIEHKLRAAGISLVFMDLVLQPIVRGRKRDIGEMIVGMIDYAGSGEFRRELAEKMIYSQIELAKRGFSTGGRPCYGFRRALVREADKAIVRILEDGERVRRTGHHVVWVPSDRGEIAIVLRIVGMLEKMPASQVAAVLTREGVPAPDSGRVRTDNGVPHPVSGVWHQSTIVSIAKNPMLVGIVVHGRRSMGDQLRFTPQGPRSLEDADFRDGSLPKVVMNPESNLVTAPASFPPLLVAERQRELVAELNRRSGTQRGKPRSRTPGSNPLGCRVFDMTCSWPMYRTPYAGSFRYVCGLYQQSHSGTCENNHVDGLIATRFVLETIRQKCLTPKILGRIEERLQRIAEEEANTPGATKQLAAKQAELSGIEGTLAKVTHNMAVADNDDQRRAMASVFDKLSIEKRRVQEDLASLKASVPDRSDPASEVAAAMELLGRLEQLATDESSLVDVGELFKLVDAKLYLRFTKVAWGKRLVNRVQGGVLTLGAAPPPIKPYEGSTNRANVQAGRQTSPEQKGGSELPPPPRNSSPRREGDSSGNVSRGDRIRTCDLLHPMQTR